MWRPDGYLMRELRTAIESTLGELGPVRDRVIDLGCGDRPYEPLFRRRGYDYVGADIEAGRADMTFEPGGRLGFAPGSFGLGVSFQVLEHVWDLDWYLGEMRRLVRQQGRMILSTHGTWLYHPHPTDFRRWTRDGLVRELESRGWRVDEVRAVAGPLAWTLTMRALGLDFALGRLGGVGRLISRVACSLYNVRACLEDRLTPAAIRDHNACVYVCLCTAV